MNVCMQSRIRKEAVVDVECHFVKPSLVLKACGSMVLIGAIGFVTPEVVAQESTVLEEVIVTAQKREQSLQDVPISVLVTSGESIEKQNLISMEELAANLPNVHISTSSASDMGDNYGTS